MTSRRKDLLWFLSFVLALGVVFAYAYRNLFSLSDFAISDLSPFYDAGRAFKTFGSLWQPDSLGRSMFNVPAHFYFGVLTGVFRDPDLAQKVYWLTLQPLAGVSMYGFLRYSGIVTSRLAVWVGAFIYAVNPATMVFFSSGTPHVSVLYAIIPLMTLFYVRLLEWRQPWLDMLVFAALLAIAASIQREAPIIVAAVMVVGAVVRFVTVRRWKYIAGVIGLSILSAVIVLLLLSTFYVFLLTSPSEYGAAAQTSPQQVQETVDNMVFNYRFASPLNVVRFLGWHMDWWPDFPGERGWVLYVFPVLALPALLMGDRKKRWHMALFAILFVGTAAFMWLTMQGQISPLLKTLYPLLALKETGKVMVLLPLALVPLVSMTLDGVEARAKDIGAVVWRRLGRGAFYGLGAVVVAASVWGNWMFFTTGDAKIADTLKVRFAPWGDNVGDMADLSAPASLAAVEAWLATREREEGYSRVLVLPVDDYSYRYWRQMSEGLFFPFSYGIEAGPADIYMQTVYDHIRTGDMAGVSDMLARASVRYVIVNKQTKWSGNIRPGIRNDAGLNGSPALFMDVLGDSSGFTLVYDDADFAAYKTARFDPRVQAFASANLVVVPFLQSQIPAKPRLLLGDNLLGAPGFEGTFDTTAVLSAADTAEGWGILIGANGETIEDRKDYRQGAGSLSFRAEADNYGNMTASLSPETHWDFSAENGLSAWFKCDATDLVVSRLRLADVNGKFMWLDFPYAQPGEWVEIRFPFLFPSGSMPEFDIRQVVRLDVAVKGEPGQPFTIGVDDVRTGRGWDFEANQQAAVPNGSDSHSGDSSLIVLGSDVKTEARQIVPVEGDTPYVISAWIKSNAGPEDAWRPGVLVNWYDGSARRVHLGSFDARMDGEPPGDWELLEVIGRSPPGTKMAEVICKAAAAPAPEAIAAFDDVMLWKTADLAATSLVAELTGLHRLPLGIVDDALDVYKTADTIQDDPWLVAAAGTVILLGDAILQGDLPALLEEKRLVFLEEFETDFTPVSGTWKAQKQGEASNGMVLSAANGGSVERELSIPRDGEFHIALSATTMANVSVAVDGKQVDIRHMDGGWYGSDSVVLGRGTHVVSVAATGECRLDQFVLYPDSFDRKTNTAPFMEVVKGSRTSYTLQVESAGPVFLFLGDTYDASWRATLGGEELSHFRGFWWGNGFYLDGAVDGTIQIEFTRQRVYASIVVVFGVTWVCVIGGITAILVRNHALKRRRQHTPGEGEAS